MLFVSSTVAVTVGLHLPDAAVTVIVQVEEPSDVFPLKVSQVSVQVPVLALGICA